MTDYELLPAQKARLEDTELAKHTSCTNSWGYKKDSKEENNRPSRLQKADWKSNTERYNSCVFQNGKAIKVPENKVDVRE